MRIAKGIAICVVAALATGGGTSLAFAIGFRFAETHWFYSYHVLMFVAASFLGGLTGGSSVAILWPRAKAGLAIAGPVVFWALLFATPNPWLRGMWLAWGEALIAIGGALLGWWGWRRLRRHSWGGNGTR